MIKKNFDNMKSYIKKSSNVFIMGHKDLDLDAIGSALGLYCFSKSLKKMAYIIVDDTKLELGTKKVINMFSDKVNFIKSSEIDNFYNIKSLLIIVDTNKVQLLQNSKIINKFDNVIIIDHHGKSNNTINIDKNRMFIDTNSSSSSEIVVNLLKRYNYVLEPEIATVLLAGIVLDTNNFIIRTNYQTYYSAYYLTKYGANPKNVQYLLKQDINEYIERQKVITEVKVVKNIAISKGLQNEIYRKEELAKIADTILLFDNIDASFVVGKLSKDAIGISARSMGNIDVGKIMEKFSGGGDANEAATVIKDKSLNEVVEEVIKISKKI